MRAVFLQTLDSEPWTGLSNLTFMADSRETRARASETKFLVEPQMADEIRRWARANLAPDPHGSGPFGDEYLTTSLYFDTPALDVLHRNGSFGRAKYRARRYANGGFVFLERKLRRPRIVAKRRTKVDLGDLAFVDNRQPPGGWPGDWFLRRLEARGLRAICQVSYQRTARGVIDDGGPARLTLDDSIRAQAIDAARFSDKPGVAIPEHRLILELKYRGYVPAIFKQLIEEFSLSPSPASKYRFGMAAIGHTVEDSAASVRESGVHA
jgi:hypothetical protein